MKCPLCAYDATVQQNINDPNLVDCSNCGKFSYWDNALDLAPESRAKLSHAVRKAQREKPFELTPDIIKEISKRELPTVVEQIDNLVLHIGKKSSPGKNLKDVATKTHQAIIPQKAVIRRFHRFPQIKQRVGGFAFLT